MRENITCLLIDDDTDDQEIFALAMGGMHIPIICHFANNGKHALEKLADESFIPDFIFLDLNMPRMNGRQCLIELKKIRRLDNTPIIIYSTCPLEQIAAETGDLGATGVIRKPNNIKELTELLAGALNLSAVTH